MKSLSARIIHGITWNSAATLSNALLQIIYTAIMARLLDPSDFGLLAMALVVMKFGDFFARMGMAHAIVQKEELTNNDVRSAFTSSAIMGAMLSVLMYSFAPLFKYAFKTADVIPIIEVLSINFFLKGLSITALGLLGRRLEFKKLALMEISTYVICNISIGIYFGYHGYGVYSLVYAGIAQQIVLLTLSMFFARPDIRPFINWATYKPLLSYGSRISVISFLEYIASSIDTFLIARFFGSNDLGLYNRARNIVYLPTYNLTVTVSRVMFPAFSLIQRDTKKLSNAYLSAITLMSAVLFPICFGMFAASKELVLVLLGDKWYDAIPLLAILSLSAPLKLTSHFGGVLCDATANLNIKLVFQIGYVLFLLSLFYVFRNNGILIFPIIILIAEFLRNVTYSILAKNILKISLIEILKSYIPGVVIGLLTGVFVYSIGLLFKIIEIPLLIQLIIKAIIGFAALITFGLVMPFGKLRIVLIERLKSYDNLNVKKFFNKLKWYDF